MPEIKARGSAVGRKNVLFSTVKLLILLKLQFMAGKSPHWQPHDGLVCPTHPLDYGLLATRGVVESNV